ncbi:cytochrome c oxidase subunit 3 [Anaeromyxobacter sp. Fw109-5]|uniref:cytochrome c oxidase subunit 3 n=1 Tax=Anaeromyxobacter sp. (strain Fw109-5) TaxID=404589 RepID=UPI0000ED7FEC|nr:cytochrome c oxidase subunit 3 [Anaeromyxobacter sp. Fw109-5]ABS27060.1 cytochrome c oxidase subunit III [Anaeromyxobacter sp. Fw109-5]
MAQREERGREPAPGLVRDLTRYRRRPHGAERTAYVGMAVFLGSWAMLFVALFFAYAFLRARAPSWPPLDAPPLPRLLPGLNTLVIAASSAAVVRATRSQELRRPRGVTAALAAAVVLGAIFLLVQGVVWSGLWRQGLVPAGGPYPSVFYAFTAFHALHVVVGLAALAWLAVRARAGGESLRTDVRLWGWYWHFVGVVWGVLYLTVYLA